MKMKSRQNIIDTYQLTLIDDSLIHSMMDALRVSLKAESALLTLYGDETAYNISNSTAHHLTPLRINTADIKNTLCAKALEIKRPLYISNDIEDPRSSQSLYISDDYEIKAVAIYPLLHKASGEMMATVSCVFRESKTLSDHEKTIFQQSCKIINDIFQSCQLKMKNKKEDTLNIYDIHKFNLDISKTHQYGFDATIYERILQYLCKLTGAKVGIIGDVKFNGEANLDFFVHNLFSDKSYIDIKNIDPSQRYMIDSSDCRFLDAIESRRNVVLNELDDDYKEEMTCLFIKPNINITKCLGIPIVSRNEMLGFIALFNTLDNFHEEYINAMLPIIITLTSVMLHERYTVVSQSYNEDIVTASEQDLLTKLPNIAGGIKYLEKVVEDNVDEFTLCFIDIDKFTYINNIYGRGFGDNALMTIAHRLNSHIHQDDFIARVGDMFMILLEGHQEKSAIESISELISNPITVGMESISLHSSIAVLHGPAPHVTGAGHFSYLIETLSIAKKFNRIEFANISDRKNREDTTSFIHDFNFAVRQNQIHLYGLPAINIETDEIMCIEVLSRWKHPEKGVLTPVHFLPYIENDNESLAYFDYSIIMKTIQFLIHAKRKKHNLPMICINISPALITHEKINDLFDYFTHDLPSDITQNICFELIEWNTSCDDLLISKELTRFRNLGIRIALDDFGTGYSNIERLKLLPIDIIKIDPSFSQELEGNDDNQQIISSIIDIAKQQNKVIIVEGIETQGQVDILSKMGCQYAQGFFFKKPTPIEYFLEHNT